MARLLAQAPLAGAERIGGVTLTPLDPGAIAWVAPYPGREAEMSDWAQTHLGASWPEPGRWLDGREGARIAWSGWAEALVLGAVPEPPGGAALVDQSDGWTALRLEGAAPEAEAVLAHLAPVDLRAATFPKGHAARTLIGEIAALVLGEGAGRFTLLIPRSYAAHARHEIMRAMRQAAARF